MPTINMFSSANKVKGQGVGSAYIEQVNLVKNNLKEYQVNINKIRKADITHYHTIDLKHYLGIPFAKYRGKRLMPMLINHIFKQFFDKKIKRIRTGVHVLNKSSIKMVKKLGFRLYKKYSN